LKMQKALRRAFCCCCKTCFCYLLKSLAATRLERVLGSDVRAQD